MTISKNGTYHTFHKPDPNPLPEVVDRERERKRETPQYYF